MSRQTAPRPLATALSEWAAEIAPEGLLARVQSRWDEVAGPAVAAEAEPVSERGGTVTIRCRSSVWAHELELLSSELLGRLNDALGTRDDRAPVAALRFVVANP